MNILNQPLAAPMYTPRRRKALTLEDRVAVIQMADAGQSARGIAAVYDVGKTQIQVHVLLRKIFTSTHPNEKYNTKLCKTRLGRSAQGCGASRLQKINSKLDSKSLALFLAEYS